MFNQAEHLISIKFLETSTDMRDSNNALNDKNETQIKTRRSSRHHENGSVKEIILTKSNNLSDELNENKKNKLITNNSSRDIMQTNSKVISKDKDIEEASSDRLQKISHKPSKSGVHMNDCGIDQNEKSATNTADSSGGKTTSISEKKIRRSSRHNASSEQANVINLNEYQSEKTKTVSTNNMHNKTQPRRSIRTGSSENGICNLENAPVTMLNNIKHKNLDDIRCKSDMSDNSDNITESSKNEPNRKLKQNLFRGLCRERVCPICEKPGNLLKCKGLCSNYYHYRCVFPAVNGSTIGTYNTTTVDMNIFEKHAQTQMLELMLMGSNMLNSSFSSSENEMADDEVGCKIVEVGKRRRSQNANDAKGSATHSINFKCQDCSNNRKPDCFICHKDEYCEKGTQHCERHKCCVSHCGNFFHVECLKGFPQTKINSGSTLRSNKSTDMLVDTFTCPHHVCHTCVSDNPRGNKSRFLNDKLSKCIKCPTSYHTSIHCIPAGTVLLTSSQIICTKHFDFCKKSKTGLVQHLNVSWCFICSVGGSLICCETCPTAFHIECLGLSQPEGGYICEDCESGRFPLYDEVVWCKLGSFRWWPARVLPPYEIPQKIQDIKHEPGGFCVRFFGSFDHHWTNRRRVFLYHEGDTAHTKSNRKSLDGMFIRAVVEAGVAYAEFKRIKEMHAAKIEGDLMPPYYIKIKTNRIVGNVKPADGDLLSATPCECNPNTEEPCGPESTCLNRMLLFECDPSICPAGDRCCNQSFEKRLYPPLTPYKTKGRGWGLKTLADIKCGQFVIEYVGDVIDDAEFKRRLERKHEEKDENYYFLILDKDRMIDAGPKGNMARFMNHSCDPNCETQKWFINGDIRVGLFAIQDIPADTELTFNYNLESTGGEKKKCHCGASKCSGYIGAKAKAEMNTNSNPNSRVNKKQSKKKRG